MQSSRKYVDYLTSSSNFSKEEATEIIQALFDLARIAFDEANA